MNDKLCVAIVGAGPAGYYTAEALTKDRDDVHVDIIDKLPTPYGLIRAGVAPDHQSIKNVSRRYEKTNTQDNVRFVGNINLGRDISLDELREIYDVIVLATGAAKDRKLDIEGEELQGVIGSAPFVGWYNSHPDFTHLKPNLKISAVAVVGNGNVAIDVARVLAKTAAEMVESDLAQHAADRIHTSNIKDIYILGRRGPMEGAFTPKELGELNQLEECVALVDPSQLPTDENLPEEMTGAQKKNITILRAMAENASDDKPVRLHIRFYERPVEIRGNDSVEILRIEHTKVIDGKSVGTGEFESLEVGMVVPCIGYRTTPIEGAIYNTSWGYFDNDEGFISEGLYCVGWAKRGPTGTIGTNKPDGIGVAKRILDEVKPGGKQGRSGLDRIAKERELEIVTFQEWKRIEAAEEAAAPEGTPRVKFADIDDMVHTAHPDS